MSEEIQPRVKYMIAGEPILTNPLCDQSFEKQGPTKSIFILVMQIAQAQSSRKAQNENKKEDSRSLIDVKETGTEKHKIVTEEAKKEPENKEAEPEKKAGVYIGKAGEVYEFLKKEYQSRRGIAFNTGGVQHYGNKIKFNWIEKDKKGEVERRANVLLDFWKQYYIKHTTRSVNNLRMERSNSKLDDSKKLPSDILKEKIHTYSEEDMKFTLCEDIDKEMNEALTQTHKAKQATKILGDHYKMEEEKRMFTKALNMHYSFEKEYLAE